MVKDKMQASTEPLKTSLSCPRCGGEVIANPVTGSGFCGVLIVASCPKGCEWKNEEQHAMNGAASEEIYL